MDVCILHILQQEIQVDTVFWYWGEVSWERVRTCTFFQSLKPVINFDLTWENNLQAVPIILVVDSENDSQNRLTDSPFDMREIWLNLVKHPFCDQDKITIDFIDVLR